MTAPALTTPLLAVYDRPRGHAGRNRLGSVAAASTPAYRRAVDGVEWIQFTTLLATADLSVLRCGAVITYALSETAADDSIEEFRISEVRRRVASDGTALLEVRGKGVIEDLSDAPALALQTSGATAKRTTFTDSRSVSSWVSLVVAHMTTEGYDHFAAGTITPTDTVTLTVAQQSPREVLNAVLAALDLAYELYVAWDQAAGKYKVHVVLAYGSSATAARVIEGLNVEGAVVEQTDFEFATHVRPRAGLGTTEVGRGIRNTRWKVTATTSSPATMTLGDPGGNAAVKCIQFNDQWNGYRFQVQRTGRRYTITDTDYATQTITVATLGDVIANEDEGFFFEDDGGLSRYYWQYQASATNLHALQVGAVTLASNYFQALDPRTGTVNNLIQGRNVMVGLKGRRSTFVASATPSAWNSGTRELTVASTTGYQAGDWGYFLNGTAFAYQAFTVDSIVSSTKFVISMRHQIPTAWSIPATPTVPFYLYREDTSRDYYVTQNTAYNNLGTDPQQTVWVDDATGLAAGDRIEFFVEIGGTPVETLPAPAAWVAYRAGVAKKERTPVFSKLGTAGSDGGEQNLLPTVADPWCDTAAVWVGPPGTENNSTAGGTHGTLSLISATKIDTGYTSTTFDTKYKRRARIVAPVGRGPSSERLLFVAYVKPTWDGVTSPATLSLVLYDGANPAVSLASFAFTIGSTLVNAAWNMLIVAFDPASSTLLKAAPCNGVALGFLGSGVSSWRLDACGLFYSEEGEALTQTLIPKHGNQRLWARGGAWLDLYDVPPATYDISVVDLYRAFRQGDKLALGGSLITRLQSLGVDTTLRVVAVEAGGDNPAQGRVTLETTPTLLTRSLVRGS